MLGRHSFWYVTAWLSACYLSRALDGQFLEGQICKEISDISADDTTLLSQLKSLQGFVKPGGPMTVHACWPQSLGDGGEAAARTSIFFSPPRRGAETPRRAADMPEWLQPQPVASESDGFAQEEVPQPVASQYDGVAREEAPQPVAPESDGVAKEEVPEERRKAEKEAEEEHGESERSAEEREGALKEGKEREGEALEEEGKEGEEGKEEGEGEEEEEEEHFGPVDVGIGGMLLGGVSFIMLLFYFVNYQDDDIRRYSWSIISTTVSIFVAVLVFKGVNQPLQETLVEKMGMESEVFFVALGYSCFLGWYALLLLFIAYETHSCSQYISANIQEESWVIANAMRWDYGTVIDSKFVRRPDSMKSIADLNSIEVFVQKRKVEGERMERRTIAVRTLFSHMAGFAAIHAGGELQQSELCRESPTMVFIAVIINRFFLFIVFKLAGLMHGSGSGEHEGMDDPYHITHHLRAEEIEEAENDISSLSTSFLLVQALRFALSGYLANIEGLEEPPRKHGVQVIGSLFGMGVACLMIAVAIMHTGLSKRYRQFTVVENTMGMALSWCWFWGFRWVAEEIKQLHEIEAGPNTMEGRILLALALSGVAGLTILTLDTMEDAMERSQAFEAGRIIQNVINALSILVGFSWEHCFDLALEAVASTQSRPVIIKLCLTTFVACTLTPAWRKYILLKVIQLNQLKDEEARASSKRLPQMS